MDDLVAFVRARLDEDEAVARAATPGLWVAGTSSGLLVDNGVYGQGDGGVEFACDTREAVAYSTANVVHIARHDPARALREVEAKREIVDEHGNVNDGSCGTCVTAAWGYPTHGGSAPQKWPCHTLRLLAAVYADHPDYREEWRL